MILHCQYLWCPLGEVDRWWEVCCEQLSIGKHRSWSSLNRGSKCQQMLSWALATSYWKTFHQWTLFGQFEGCLLARISREKGRCQEVIVATSWVQNHNPPSTNWCLIVSKRRLGKGLIGIKALLRRSVDASHRVVACFWGEWWGEVSHDPRFWLVRLLKFQMTRWVLRQDVFGGRRWTQQCIRVIAVIQFWW